MKNTLTAAENKYQAAMSRINRAEKVLELEMNKIDTEHNAVIKEIDSVKKVIDSNIERTYKLFDA